MSKSNKLVEKRFLNGNVEYSCPHCKKAIFEGFWMGITIYDLNGKCPYCQKEVITPWDNKLDPFKSASHE